MPSGFKARGLEELTFQILLESQRLGRPVYRALCNSQRRWSLRAPRVDQELPSNANTHTHHMTGPAAANSLGDLSMMYSVLSISRVPQEPDRYYLETLRGIVKGSTEEC